MDNPKDKQSCQENSPKSQRNTYTSEANGRKITIIYTPTELIDASHSIMTANLEAERIASDK